VDCGKLVVVSVDTTVLVSNTEGLAGDCCLNRLFAGLFSWEVQLRGVVMECRGDGLLCAGLVVAAATVVAAS
jgi:hypothetical protein